MKITRTKISDWNGILVRLGLVALIAFVAASAYSTARADTVATPLGPVQCYSQAGQVPPVSDTACPIPESMSVQCVPGAPGAPPKNNIFYEKIEGKDVLKCYPEVEAAEKIQDKTDMMYCARGGGLSYQASLKAGGCYKDDPIGGCPWGYMADKNICKLIPQNSFNSPAQMPLQQMQVQPGATFGNPQSPAWQQVNKVLKKKPACPKNYVLGKGKKANTCVKKKVKKAAR